MVLRYSDEELLDALRECEDMFDSVTMENFDDGPDSWPSASTVVDRFGSWTYAKREAGLDIEEDSPYSDEEVLEMLQECKRRYGECPPRLFNQDDDFCSASLVMRRFGSWTEAKEAAGIEEDLSSNTGREKQYTNEQILSHLKEAHRRDGKVTVESLQDHDDLVGPTTVVERFGSWAAAKESAGLDSDERVRNARPREYTNEEFVEMLKQCHEKNGKVTQRVFDNDDEFPSSAAVRKRFGSWSEAKAVAGLEGSGEAEYDDDDLLEMLRECQQKYGKCTAKMFAADEAFCAPETVQRRFGSWSKGKERAGLE